MALLFWTPETHLLPFKWTPNYLCKALMMLADSLPKLLTLKGRIVKTQTELSLERHTKPLTICRAILTFIFSPLRRTFSRLTNSSASFRDSSCNKKTHQQWTCYCTLSTVKSAASQHPHGVKRMVVQDRLILQTPYNALLKVRTVIVAKQN